MYVKFIFDYLTELFYFRSSTPGLWFVAILILIQFLIEISPFILVGIADLYRYDLLHMNVFN